MEWLLAISHKPLIVLWSWIVAFYHPAMVKGTFATGVGHGIFSGNANGFQGSSFFLYQTLVISTLYTLYLLSYTVSSSPNPTQFLSIWMNMLISLSIITLIKLQKHLSRVNVYITIVPLL